MMATLHTQPATPEPGSFRDPDSRVFYAGDAVYRALSTGGASTTSGRCSEAGLLEGSPGSSPPSSCTTPPSSARGWSRRRAGVLRARADPVRVVSVRVDVLDAQGRRAAPARPPAGRPRAATSSSRTRPRTTCSSGGGCALFVDVGSFERLRPGEPWAGYRQFCMLYLYPLLLQAARRACASSRGCAARSRGITATGDEKSLIQARDHFRARGLLTHVFPPRTARAPLRGSRGRRGQGRSAAGPAFARR